MSFEKRPFPPEDYQTPKGASSDYPLTKPREEWVPEAKSNTLSPEDQTALRELLNHWKQAKKTGETAKINKTIADISELLDREVDDADLVALQEAMGETEEEEEEMTVEEPTKTTKETSEAKKLFPETVGREKARHGTHLPIQIGGPEQYHSLKYTKKDQREPIASKGRKPIWKSRRSKKRKTALAA